MLPLHCRSGDNDQKLFPEQLGGILSRGTCYAEEGNGMKMGQELKREEGEELPEIFAVMASTGSSATPSS